MIRPSKYLDLDVCILNISSLILSELRETRVFQLDELNSIIQNRLGEASKYNFLPSLSFLFLVGNIDYDEENDVIFLKDHNSE